MKTIAREQALNLLSCIDLINYSEEKIQDVLSADYLDEEGNSKEYDDIYSTETQIFLIEFIKQTKNYGVINEYLIKVLENTGFRNFVVKGEAPVLAKCPCCDYKTLTVRGEFEICRVCFWEDDGRDINSESLESHVNHMNLEAARKNFKEIGSCSRESKEFVDPNGPLKFAK